MEKVALDHITCNRCGTEKSVDQFYFNKARNRHRTTCKTCWLDNPAPNSGRRTPEQRAAYRRMRGETLVRYLPRSVRLEIAGLKRIALANAPRQRRPLDDSHVRAWKLDEMRRQRQTLTCDAHVRVFKNGIHDWRARYKTDPEFALRERLRTQGRKRAKLFPKLDDLIRSAINRGGNSRTVADVCGYTITELKQHIESRFADGMNWDEFMKGNIHIDHIKPQRLFDMSSVDGVKACWALGNLQPLWRRDNLAKGGRWDGGDGAATERKSQGTSGALPNARALRTAFFDQR